MKKKLFDPHEILFVKSRNEKMIFFGLDHQSKENGKWVDKYRVGRITKSGEPNLTDVYSTGSKFIFPNSDFEKVKPIEYLYF